MLMQFVENTCYVIIIKPYNINKFLLFGTTQHFLDTTPCKQILYCNFDHNIKTNNK